MSHHRYVTKLREQLQYIATSAAQYDTGVESEAMRIAVALRVLFHTGSQSTPLLSLLNMRTWEILSTAQGSVNHLGFTNMVIDASSSSPVSAVPKLGTEFAQVSIDDWWAGQEVDSYDGKTVFRKDLVCTAANQDGGAHVDKNLKPWYEHLASGAESLGLDGKDLVYPTGAPYDQSVVQFPRNIHLAMIRQFGHEVLVSARHFGWLRRLGYR